MLNYDDQLCVLRVRQLAVQAMLEQGGHVRRSMARRLFELPITAGPAPWERRPRRSRKKAAARFDK
jgi:hypothetical protein